MKDLTDASPMPFGTHKGKRMQDVPASYFYYLWTHGKYEDTKCPVHWYIIDNRKSLQKEHPDGIWD